MELEPITREEKIIAGQDLTPVTRMEKFLKEYGVSNYFGEFKTVVNEPLNITWDGNTEGLVAAYLTPSNGDAPVMYKISDIMLTDEQIKNSVLTTVDGKLDIAMVWDEFVAEGLIVKTDKIVWVTEFAAFVRVNGLADETLGSSITFPESGIFFGKQGDTALASALLTEPIEQTKTVVKKLDMKFLPIDEIKAALGI